MKVNKQRIIDHINELSNFTATPGEGVTRFSYSEEDLQARNYIKARMQEYGLIVSEDGLGNIFGKLAGKIKDGPSVLVGSHFDSVPHGGRYDGTAGVVAALEVAALFHEKGITPKYPLEVIALVEEEGSRYGIGLLGSRGMIDSLNESELMNLKDRNNVPITESMQTIGLKPFFSEHRKPETMKAFLELHIEQGPILEEKQIPIGIVERIVGLAQLEVTVIGKAGHAGTTPMDGRADALVAGSTIVSRLPRIANKIGEGTVITTGQHDVYPNGSNVIPDKVVFTVDVRSSKEENIKQAIKEVEQLASSNEDKGIKVSIRQPSYLEPKNMNKSIQSLLIQASDELGVSHCLINSGAAHDAMAFSDVTRAGMVFVPSKDGLSHCPEEWSDPEDLARGTEVLYEAVKKLTES